jgi:hypothetical protein
MPTTPSLPPATLPPPDVPYSTNIDVALTGYLRRFSLWAKKSLDDKQPLGQAQSGLMLMSYDTPAGQTPKVFLLQVNEAGNFVTTPMPVGGGAP